MAALLDATRVAFGYPQNGYGLQPTSLSIQPGTFTLVSGPSGCGKSTLTRCLTGLIPHLYRGQLTGEVRLEGLVTSETPLWRLAERAGLVFQNPAAQMLTESVEEEIVFGLENLGRDPAEIGRRLEQILDQFGLSSMRRRSPQSLSGGEQQKLALAAIIARQPPLLVLDEPLSMLDGTAATDLIVQLQAYRGRDTAVVICEHRAEYLEQVPGLMRVELNGRSGLILPLAPAGLGPAPVGHTSPFCLQIRDLNVSRGGRPVLRSLNLTLEGGQVVAIVGRNGVGKTTLLRCLTGLQEFDGVVSIDGRQPDLGLVFQNADLQLFNATVRDEILYRVPNPDRTLFRYLLEALGLARYEDTPPLLLSEGEKKRVALAMVAMRRPRHGILLDEPSLGQDAGHKAILISLARAMATAGYLVVLTTHDLTLAVQADRLLLLGPDGCAADGPPADVLGDDRAWARLGLTVPAWIRPGGSLG